MQQFEIVSALFTLELIDGYLTEINSQEIDKLFVIFDIFCSIFDDLLKVSDFRLLSRLALEERFQSGLSLGEFLMFNLVTSLLALSFSKFSDYGLPASNGLLKAFQVQEFTF